MPLDSTLEPDDKLAVTKLRSVRLEQRLKDQKTKFVTFLNALIEKGLPFPARGREIVVAQLLSAADLPLSLAKKFPALRKITNDLAQINKVALTSSEKFRAALPAPILEPLSSIVDMTYQQLFDLDAAALNLNSPRSLTSYQSMLQRFMKFAKKTRTDQIGHELHGNYDEAIEQFVQMEYKGDNLKAKSARSYVRKYQQVVAGQQLADFLPAALSSALRVLVERSGRTIAEISNITGINSQSVNRLIRGIQKTAPIVALEQLEREFGVNPGTLTLRNIHINPRARPDFAPRHMFPKEWQGDAYRSRNLRTQVRRLLPDTFPALPTAEQQRMVTDTTASVLCKEHLSPYGRVLSQAADNPYILKPEQLTPQLRQEIDGYCQMKYKTGSMAGRKKGKGKQWRAGKKGKKATEHRWRQSLEMFFGWCLLPTHALNPMGRGAGKAPEDLTLGLILIPELIIDYVAYRNLRANGTDTTTCNQFLIDCLTMLRANDGWVEGHPELLERMPEAFQAAVQQDEGGWKARCAEQFMHITAVMDDAEFMPTRVAFEPIQALIDTQRPMDLVQNALSNNYREIQDKIKRGALTDVEIAEMYRDHFLISMLAAFPLRASHWFGMTYHPLTRTTSATQPGELRHVDVDNQGWMLMLPASDFKNAQNKLFGSNRDKPTVLSFHADFSELEALADDYMTVYRPQLCVGAGPVFPNIQGEALTGQELYNIVRRWTRRYLSEHGDRKYGLNLVGVRPFGPHAFRHLMATHILKTTGDLQGAADMLLDSLEMILKYYGDYLPGQRVSHSIKRLDIIQAVRAAV